MGQGEQLDLIGEDLDKSLGNVTRANEELEKANEYSKEHNRCCWWGLLLVVAGVCLILVLVLVLCFPFY
mgnify:CR=1 FL=1